MAIGKPVAFEASADERDTRGFISITRSSPVPGSYANWTFAPPVATPTARARECRASRRRWYSPSAGSAAARRSTSRRCDAHRIEVLDRADDDAVAGRVASPRARAPASLRGTARRAPGTGLASRPWATTARALRRRGDPAAGAAEREGGADDRRQREAVGVGDGRDDDALRYLEAGGGRRLAEGEAVLRAPDRVGVGADQLDAEPVEHARVDELDGDVQRRLAASVGRSASGRSRSTISATVSASSGSR